MKKSLFVIAILSLFVIMLYRCDRGVKKIADDALIDTTYTINIKPFPPAELDSGADPKKLAEFAWEEFLALNWKSSFDKDGKRDFPDTTWSYASEPGAYPALDVWETYAHRTELRPSSNKMLQFDRTPKYSYADSLNLLPETPTTSFTLFNNLDENNEIGSCNLYAHTDKYSQKYQVLYEAKVNRFEYEYVKKYHPDSLNVQNANNKMVKNIQLYHAYYKGATTTCNCPIDSNVICLPCGSGKFVGTMEIKAAWRKLVPSDDSTKFFTRKVINYTVNSQGKVIYHNTTYALIGLHIIHKTANYPAFIFATWEHIGVEQDHMGYTILSSSDSAGLRTPRRDPILAVTNGATAYVHKKLPATSIWQNYRLVGVQAQPTNDSTSANFYLSNYVVESDFALNHFHGSGIGKPHNGKPNLINKGIFYSMGGCQGCHGAGQVAFGTDFSFLLDHGHGKPAPGPDTSFANPAAKFRRLAKAFDVANAAALKLTKGKPNTTN